MEGDPIAFVIRFATGAGSGHRLSSLTRRKIEVAKLRGLELFRVGGGSFSSRPSHSRAADSEESIIFRNVDDLEYE